MRILLLFSLLLAGLQAMAQAPVPPKAVKARERGLAAERQRDIAKARRELEKALHLAPLYYEAQSNLASILVRQGDSAAIPALERLLELDPDRDPYAWLALADLLRERERWSEAADRYEGFLQRSGIAETDAALARRHLANARFAALAVLQPVPFRPERLGPEINRAGQMQYGALPSGDGRTLLFTRRVGGQEDFFLSVGNADGWQEAMAIPELNTPENEGMHVLSRDGRTLVFTRCRERQGLGSCDLYASIRRSDGRWGAVANLGAGVNSARWDAQPALSADGSLLVFSSDRPGGRGASDLWQCRRLSGGEWSAPEPLPGQVNGTGREQTPFLHADGRTLYFSSESHPGMGGMDLFVSRWHPDSGWLAPVNLGHPINTSGDEGALTLANDGRTAFYATDRFREDDSDSGIYVYRFELPESVRGTPVTFVEGRVRDAADGRGLPARVRLAALSDQLAETLIQAGEDGYFLVCLPSGTDYGLQVGAEGYLFHSEHFALSDSTAFRPYMLEVGLERLAAGDTVEERRTILRNVLFASGSADLLPGSGFDLEAVRAILQQNPGWRIRVEGHTDDVGGMEENRKLSEARAKAVREWLVAKGIQVTRIEAIGFGESRPVADNRTNSGRQLNRRTELVIFP